MLYGTIFNFGQAGLLRYLQGTFPATSVFVACAVPYKITLTSLYPMIFMPRHT